MRNIFILFVALAFTYGGPTKKVYNVEGMICGVGCVNTINKTIKSLNGVEDIKVDFINKKMEVIFDDDNIKSENIISSLPDPYKATFIKETVSKEYTVNGMTCMGCVNSIRNAIDGLEGLENYEVNFEQDMLYIEFDIKKTDDKKILSRIPEKFKVVELVSVKEDKAEEEEAEELKN
jgi:copper ion binding protein